MNINDSLFKKPYSLTSAGKEYGTTLGGGGGGSTDSVIISGAHSEYEKSQQELQSKISKNESLIEMNKMELEEPLFELKPEEKTKLKSELEKLEKEKTKLTQEKEATKVDTEDFAKTGVKGEWQKEGGEFELTFTDADNKPNLSVKMDVGFSNHIPYLMIDNQGQKGDGDNLGIVLPVADPLKNEKAVETFLGEVAPVLEHLPADVKNVEVKKEYGFFKDTTTIHVKGDKGEDLSFKIVNGKVKK
jgi:hypothetical protein